MELLGLAGILAAYAYYVQTAHTVLVNTWLIGMFLLLLLAGAAAIGIYALDRREKKLQAAGDKQALRKFYINCTVNTLLFVLVVVGGAYGNNIRNAIGSTTGMTFVCPEHTTSSFIVFSKTVRDCK